MIKQILFICSGNVCRSAMASSYFNTFAEELGIYAKSAGIEAAPGDEMTEMAKRVMLRDDIDGSDHRSQAISSYLIDESDLIVTMTRQQLMLISSIFPEAAERAVMLQTGKDITVPREDSDDSYSYCYGQVKVGVNALVERFRNDIKDAEFEAAKALAQEEALANTTEETCED